MNEQLMLEYIFFHRKPYQQFLEFLREQHITPLKEGTDQTDIQGLVVYLQDNLDDELSERIEDFYDAMMAIDEELVMDDAEADEMSQVGVAVTLNDGRSVLASVDPMVLNRVLTVISHQQLGELVDAIAYAVENPDDRPLCKRT
jgi:hypothetical protein